jgi:hypothetical protein
MIRIALNASIPVRTHARRACTLLTSSMGHRLHVESKRSRDFNQNKLGLDTLAAIAYEDNSQIKCLSLVRQYDKDRPRVETSVQRCVENQQLALASSPSRRWTIRFPGGSGLITTGAPGQARTISGFGSAV